MIKKVLDFKDINTTTELAKYLSEELHFSHPFQGRSWDAYIDLFSEIIYKEFTGEYREEDMWDDYDDYLDYLEMEKEIGLKNEQGVRDDLELIFVNFYQFHYKHTKLADEFLHCTLSAINGCLSNNSCDEYLKIELHIKS